MVKNVAVKTQWSLWITDWETNVTRLVINILSSLINSQQQIIAINSNNFQLRAPAPTKDMAADKDVYQLNNWMDLWVEYSCNLYNKLGKYRISDKNITFCEL